MQQNQLFSPYYGDVTRNVSMMDNTGFRQPMNEGYYQPQQQLQYRQQSTIPGRIVESMDVLKGVEIPMDGNAYYFPKADGTEIYTKRWLNNGSTQVTRYVIKTDEEQQAEDNFLVNKLNSIEDQLQKLVSQRQNNYYNKPNKNSKGNYERRDSE